MAHVQIPAKEDVMQFPFHHAGVSETPSFSLTGEGCEIEQVKTNAFVIRVSQPAAEALADITDLGPLWDALHDLEKHVKWTTEHADFNLQDSISRGKLAAAQLERLAGHLSLLEARQNVISANLAAARDLGRYALTGAALSTALVVGMLLWILNR